MVSSYDYFNNKIAFAGHRLPGFYCWLGHIQPGAVVNEVSWSPDLMSACAGLAGAKLPGGIIFDGKNPLPMLTAGARSEPKSLFFVYQNDAALREGDLNDCWKVRMIPGSCLTSGRTWRKLIAWLTNSPDRVARLEAGFDQWQNTF